MIDIGNRSIPSPDVYAQGVALGELNSASGLELVVASGSDLSLPTYTGNVQLFDSDGNVLWTYQSTVDGYALGVSVGDINGDGDNEIAVGFNYPESKAILLNKNGGFLWSYSMGAGYQYCRGVAIGKVRSDYQNNQLVVSGFNSKLALLDKDGNQIWLVTVGGSYTVQSVAIADTNADGQNEIICAHERYVHKYNHLGSKVWSSTIGDADCTVISVAAGHVTSLTELQIAATVFPRAGGGTIQRCVLLNKDGTEIWHWNAPYGCSGVALADLNGDGYDEVIVGYGNHDNTSPNPLVDTGGVSVLSSSGTLLASIDLPSTVGFIAYGDVDNDGENEILASCDDAKVHILKFISTI